MENPITFKPTTDGSKRPLARNRILSARFMESEYAALENFAWSKGTDTRRLGARCALA